MENNDNYLDLMEKYLGDSLDQEEVAEFHKRLKTDPGFRHLFNEMDLIIDGIQYSASKTTLDEKFARLEASLDDKEEDEDEEISEEKNQPKIILIWNGLGRYRTAIAASVVMLIVATVLFITTDSQPYSEVVFAANFDPNPVIQSAQRGEETGTSLNWEAFSAFRDKDYETASILFARILQEDPGNNEIRFFSGICQLQQHDLENAELSFMKTIDNEYKVNSSKWYLSLCYIRGEEYDKARGLLNEIKTDGASRAEEASELLKDLEKL